MAENRIFPDNMHLKICIYSLTAIGVWPMELKNYPILSKVYLVWSNFIYFYNLGYIVTMFMEAYILISNGKIDKLMQNMGLSLLCLISLFRVTIVRGPLSKKFVKLIFDFEKMVLKSEDEDIIKIYKKHAKLSQNVNLFFMMVGYLTTIPFYIIPMYAEKLHKELYIPNNITGKIENQRPLPFSSWYPYDTNDHYAETFGWQVFTGPVIEGFVVYTDSYLFSLMIFAVGQMKILQHIFSNFKVYSEKLKNMLDVNDDQGSVYAIKACIMFHQEIIQYVEELNQAVRTVMLLDFMSCSIQMSVIVFQIIMNPFGLQMLHAIEFLASMIIQMFLFYWNANEIILESMAISKSIEKCEWYTEPEEVKKTMQLIIMRAQKPLTVSIGKFNPMSTDTAIAILKATYSYGMLLRQSYNRKL